MKQSQEDCDISPMKGKIKNHLSKVISEINHSIDALENENECLLTDFARIREKIMQTEAIAASFYLRCYLSSYTDKYEDLATCIRHLSERRHGALIVIERNDSLDTLIQPGVPIGAVLSPSLVESIFFPGSPLHDGALLVKGSLIVSAAHILPLSHIAAGKTKFGTRHRAALGLSEESDALIIVVSEETGQASFALNGLLYPLNP